MQVAFALADAVAIPYIAIAGEHVSNYEYSDQQGDGWPIRLQRQTSGQCKMASATKNSALRITTKLTIANEAERNEHRC